ncbi:hypothetical protein LTR70_004403 [Exophiala xenobiotica]|uniref:Major facilitator superfamily (MFS) profile domain-containing protein n=1 Tax=Lithohypha guttulata TaxID=1690604 RepID=A0ABR0KDF9_9EURO|nr:hypothetical protein LTR24_003882 [Lithohypha guttulata]KAK5320825.1 hypothetical protein LTR70_004403 [Exophiala xenobiotica]
MYSNEKQVAPANHDTKEEPVLMLESASGSESHLGFDKRMTSKLVRKIDRHIVPFLALLYLLSYLDRTNIGNARLGGLEKDLGMSGLDYNIALAVFFPTYVLVEIPSNMALKRWRPSIVIPTMMVVWAIVTTLMGISQNFSGLVGARAVLGLAEGGLYPGCNYYITMWYRRHECGFRMAFFYSAATAAGAFGGLLARGIIEMAGVANLSGWQWLFILEGLLTFVVAIGAYFVMSDWPATAKFLTPTERKEVTRRLKDDHDGLSNEYDNRYFWDAIKDWKVYVHMLITIAIYTSNYSVALFLPTIVRTLGYNNETAQLMTVPPYIVACCTCIGAGLIGDKFRQRGVFMLVFGCLSIVGLVMLIASHNFTVKYAATFLVTAGLFPNVPLGTAWVANNIGGSLKRGVAIAMNVAFGNLGGVLASFIFLTKDSPQFMQGLAILIGLNVMAMILASVMTMYYRRENKRRDAEHKNPELYSDDEKHLETTKGDHATFFRYTI